MPRIVYPGAVYHLISRGDHRQAIFLDDADRERFLETLAEVCERTGWVVHAYALMGNHYHVLAETPEPNLVEGMKWFQGTYTQRFNRRHGVVGHLYQGRYKALVVQGVGSDYFRKVADYIHLNPARAGFLDSEQPDVRSYPWSSAPYFGRSHRNLAAWLNPAAVFRSMGIEADTPSGRRRFTALLNALARSVLDTPDNPRWQKEWDQIRRGWYLGEKSFRDRLVREVGDILEENNRASYQGQAVRRHDTEHADRELDRMVKGLGLSPTILKEARQNDPYKQAIAWWLKTRTTVSDAWLSEKLHMGNRTNVYRAVAAYRDPKDRERNMIKRKMQQCAD